MSDKLLIKQILKELELLKQENVMLRKRIKELEKHCAKYEHPKNSSNSSIPPSQDPFRKTKSLRQKSDKKPGGQKGHKLKMISNPDDVVVYDIVHCTCCGNDLPDNNFSYKTRQVFDIPEIKIHVTEHHVINKTCSNCGKENQVDFPEGLVQEAQYGVIK